MDISSINILSQWVGVSPFWIAVAITWTLAWKGLALWRSALLQQKWWFVAILLINTLGLLEIIYLFFVSKNYRVEVVEK